ATTYFIFLMFYYQPRIERKQSGFDYAQPSWQEPTSTSSIHVSPKNIKLIVVIAMLCFFGFLIILMIIGFATGENSPDVTEDASINVNENRELLQSDPTNIEALTNIGNSFYSGGQYDSAILYYDRVLTVDSKNSSGLYNKALACYQKKEYQKSMDLLRQCISLYPDNADAFVVLGDNYYALNELMQSLEWYKQAYAKGARSAGMLNIMAYIHDTQNQKSEAIRFYKESLQQDSSLVDVYLRLAELEPNQSDWYKKKAQAWQ
ncbi:MAG: hypothetical protein RI909_2292, partial [Bacteroidota bacterium]